MLINMFLISSILGHFNVPKENYLGEGGESLVYKMNDKKILRIQKQLGSKPYHMMQELKQFYDSLNITKECFAIPRIKHIGMYDNICYSIEELIEGESLTSHLKGVCYKNVYHALKSYLSTAAQVHHIKHNIGTFFGEVLADNPIQTSSWPEFLINRVDKALETSRNYIQEDVKDFNTLVSNWKSRVKQMTQVTQNHLVHGDFFPSNVMVDTHGRVKSVIDFSPLTVLGDWRMDVVGAYIFLELTDSYQKEQSSIARQILTDMFGYTINEEIIDLYRTYYSLYFSVVKKTGDDKLYKWCTDNLNNKNQIK